MCYPKLRKNDEIMKKLNYIPSIQYYFSLKIYVKYDFLKESCKKHLSCRLELLDYQFFCHELTEHDVCEE